VRYLAATAAAIAATLCIAPAGAQVSVGPGGVRSGNTVIDARGVHTRGADVTAAGVRTRAPGGRRGRESVNIVTNGGRSSVDCRGGTLAVDGNRNRVQAANCRAVTVSGNDNVVVAAFSQRGSLSVPGNRNQVSWRAAPGVLVAVSNLGNRNAVSRQREQLQASSSTSQ
jgi:hypothetical protein